MKNLFVVFISFKHNKKRKWLPTYSSSHMHDEGHKEKAQWSNNMIQTQKKCQKYMTHTVVTYRRHLSGWSLLFWMLLFLAIFSLNIVPPSVIYHVFFFSQKFN